jgi:hypothetical protein
MTRWSCWELQLAWLKVRTRHLVGRVVETQSGRVSAAIVSIDSVSRTATTESGRNFTLQGPPGVDPDAQYLLTGLIRLRAGTDERNVTAEVAARLSDIRS